jgi:hypothetical protein
MGNLDSLIVGGTVLLALTLVMNNQQKKSCDVNRRRRVPVYERMENSGDLDRKSDNSNQVVPPEPKVRNDPNFPKVPERSQGLGKNEMPQGVPGPVIANSCYPQKILTAADLLPNSNDAASIDSFNQDYPIGEGILRAINFLEAGYHTGVNTVGQSLRNANKQLRSEPPNPQVAVSPWMNTTIAPDLIRRPLDVTDSCALEKQPTPVAQQ